MRKCLPCISIFTDWRNRLLRGSDDAQTAQEQPTTGTPVEVPLPRKVTRISGWLEAQVEWVVLNLNVEGAAPNTRSTFNIQHFASQTVTQSNAPVSGSIAIASPVSYHAGRTVTVAAPGRTSLWWK